MSILVYFIAPMIAVTVVHLIMHAKYKNSEKIDKGFVFIYHKLTYRRKFIRSLWNIPIFTLIFLGVYWSTNLTSTEYMIFAMICIFLFLLDFLYTFVKWRKSEKGSFNQV
ncbi:hypothetical protein [Oceanobacillus iheyensis HTE831]|uniref:Uncharacterized protein n=1 Tax=Oceanobacillus iheyensis (strain DSM 14371 / CIP 107618 / JCM 11309 / KCTC 3954 / HTE831) TaxID=221109 RepID=Q8EL42_OCEIH|nr:hypothetical protein [Oceanobacillus iheyensis HTE831]